MIGIMSAMEEEIRLLSADLIVREERTIANRKYKTGILYGKEVVIVLSRWGKVAASQTATTLINLFGVDSMIFTGVAGGADPALNIGDIVISSELVQHDVDASAVPPMKRFEIPLLGISHFQSDDAMSESAFLAAKEYVEYELQKDVLAMYLEKYKITLPQVVKGLVASGDQFMADPVKMLELRNVLLELKCVEMEGAAVAQVCYEHHIPYVAIRILSDKADHSAVIDFPMFVEHIAAHYTRGIVKGMLGRL